MPRKDQLKRKLLRQAVREDLETRGGLVPRRLRRGYRWRRVGLRVGVAALVLLLLGGSAWLLTEVMAGPDEMLVVTQLIETPAAMSTDGAAATTVLPPEMLPVPGGVDPSMLSLGVRRIILDPGHGGVNVGTVAPGGLQEKEITLDVGLRLRELLVEGGFDVRMTRETDEVVDLDARTHFANQETGDIFVSIHVNWLETRNVRGVETYYLGPTNDPYLRRIAAAENRGSSYSLADFRNLMDTLYAGVRQEESRALAEAMQRRLFRSLRQLNPQLRDRGVKTAPFVVLLSTEMPAVLVEVAALSNREEAQLLSKPFYRQFIAQALFEGIRAYAESLVATEETS